MTTQDQIIKAMDQEHCYSGMVELYHAWFGIQHTYVGYNQECLYITEDLEAPLNDFTFRQFLSDDKIIDLMEKTQKDVIVKSMTLQDAIQVFKDTNCYGTMDIAKTVILKALKQESIINKIRADINKLTVYYTTKDKGINLISQNAVNRIFDKYKKVGDEQ